MRILKLLAISQAIVFPMFFAFGAFVAWDLSWVDAVQGWHPRGRLFLALLWLWTSVMVALFVDAFRGRK